MFAPAYSRCLQVEQVGDAVIVSFGCRELVDDVMIRWVGEQLLNLAATVAPAQLIINLAGVERFSTMMLGKLIALNRMMRSRGGRLVLCRIDRRIYEIFRIFNFRRLMPIYTGEPEALQNF
jgi:anti-anti-sigma factor